MNTIAIYAGLIAIALAGVLVIARAGKLAVRALAIGVILTVAAIILGGLHSHGAG